MFKPQNIIYVCLLIFSSNVCFAQDAKQCIKEWQGGYNLKAKWGEHCGTSDSITFEITNTCNQPIYVKVCVEEPGGRMNCGSDSSLAPGTTNHGFWACHGTGRVMWAACTGGYQECGFKSPLGSH